MADLPIPELIENRRRSIAMLPAGTPALNRDEALELLAELKAALLELRRLRAQVEARAPLATGFAATSSAFRKP